MKKILISLLLIIVILTGSKLDVYAQSYTDKFIISNEIEGISYAKVKNGKTEYRKAKFKRRVSDNKIVYCIEPFVDMIENTNYRGYDYNYEKLLNMTKEDWTRISLLAYYGYGYKNHTESKWYPITQIMIWETIDKDATFYWTKTFKGEKVIRYTNEMNELDLLVKNHSIKPSFDNNIIDESIDKEIVLEDKNKVLNNYKIVNNVNDIRIEDNKLIIAPQNENKILNIELEKKDQLYNNNPIIYISNTYQNVLFVGSYETIKSSLSINIESGSLKITKLDEDNMSIIPSGEGSLIGTVYKLYLENEEIKELIIGEDSTIYVDKLKYGNYMLKEYKSGTGYTIDLKEYYFTIGKDNKEIELELTNKVIKQKIKIYKYIEDKEKLEVEKNIEFEIYNKDNTLVKKIKTNEKGEAEFELPYGKYTIKQINTTNGYQKVNDFIIEVVESKEEIKEYFLYDLKIPNTSLNDYTRVYISLFFILILLFGLKIRNEKNI